MVKYNKKKSNGHWTKERCQEESLKYKTKTDFHKYSLLKIIG